MISAALSLGTPLVFFATGVGFDSLQKGSAKSHGEKKGQEAFSKIRSINKAIVDICSHECTDHPNHIESEREGMASVLKQKISEMSKGDLRLKGLHPLFSYLLQPSKLSTQAAQARYQQVHQLLKQYNQLVTALCDIEEQMNFLKKASQTLSEIQFDGEKPENFDLLCRYVNEKIEDLGSLSAEMESGIEKAQNIINSLPNDITDRGLYPKGVDGEWEPLSSLTQITEECIAQQRTTEVRYSSEDQEAILKASESAADFFEAGDTDYELMQELSEMIKSNFSQRVEQAAYEGMEDDEISLLFENQQKLVIRRDGTWEIRDSETDEILKQGASGNWMQALCGKTECYLMAKYLGLETEEVERLVQVWGDGFEDHPEISYNCLYYTFKLKNAVEQGNLLQVVKAECRKINKSGLQGNASMKNRAYDLFEAGKFLREHPKLCVYGTEAFQASLTVIEETVKTAEKMAENARDYDPTHGGYYHELAKEYEQDLQHEPSDAISPIGKVVKITIEKGGDTLKTMTENAKKYDPTHGGYYDENAAEIENDLQGEYGFTLKALNGLYQRALEKASHYDFEDGGEDSQIQKEVELVYQEPRNANNGFMSYINSAMSVVGSIFTSSGENSSRGNEMSVSTDNDDHDSSSSSSWNNDNATSIPTEANSGSDTAKEETSTPQEDNTTTEPEDFHDVSSDDNGRDSFEERLVDIAMSDLGAY